MPADWKQQLDAILEDMSGETVSLRRHLHSHPEPSGSELETSLLLYQRLSEAGLDVRMGPDGCGVIAENRTSDHRDRVALRGDIDALLIHDEKSAPYRSTVDGVMHACGHDAHAAIVTAAALALIRLEQTGAVPWRIAWRAILQPSEETAVGARQMIGAGALEGVRAIYALHVDPMRRAGEVGVRVGPFTAQCDALEIAVHGRGGHGARPHESKDPIAASAQLINTLYQYVPRGSDSQDAVVLSFGHIRGGENPNVIPEHVELSGTLRTLDAQVRARTIEHIHQLARGVEAITGTHIQVDFGASIPSVNNNAEANRAITQAATDVVGAAQVKQIPRPSMGSEDFACYLETCPGAMFRLGSAANLDAATPLHTPRFDIDEQALNIGARILARAVVIAFQGVHATGGI